MAMHLLKVMFLGGIFCIISCGKNPAGKSGIRPEVSSKQELDEWIAANRDKLSNSRKMDDIQVNVMFLPDIDQASNTYSFVMKISSASQQNLFNQPNSRYKSNDTKMMYWSSSIQRRLYLVTDRDTMPCCMSVFENLGNISNDITVNIGFSGKKTGHKNYTLVYDDQYFDLGMLKFNFDEIITQSPILAIN